MDKLELVRKICAENGIIFDTDVPMSAYTTFRIGGPADMLAMPDTTEKLAAVIEAAVKNDIPYTVIGKGSNVLVSDSGIRGLVIVTSKCESIALRNDCELVCAAGTPLVRVCSFALEHSLGGLEFAYGIPGSAGGAAFMNAGAYGGEMKDVLVSCRHIDKNAVRGEFVGDELELGYRKSVYSGGGYVITDMTLRLYPDDKNAIKAKMDDFISRRKAKQPLEYPSAGSTFKRPEGYFAGALIEQCGLKGFSVGGAQVSEKHAGFVVNKGGATAADVLELVESVRDTVFRQTGVTLEPEIKML